MTVSTRSAISPPVLGFDASKQYATTSTVASAAVETVPVDQLPQFPLGAKVETDDGDVYRFVEWTAAKTAGLVYVVDENWVVQAGVTTTTAAEPTRLGIFATTTTAPASLHANANAGRGWIQTAGNFDVVTTSNDVSANVAVYSTATAGKVDDNASSTYRIHTLTLLTATTAAENTTGFSAQELHVAGAIGTTG